MQRRYISRSSPDNHARLQPYYALGHASRTGSALRVTARDAWIHAAWIAAAGFIRGLPGAADVRRTGWIPVATARLVVAIPQRCNNTGWTGGYGYYRFLFLHGFTASGRCMPTRLGQLPLDSA